VNIVFITHDISLYGANRSMISLIEGLKSQNINAYVIIPDHGIIESELKEKNIEYTVIKIQWWMSNDKKTGFKYINYKYRALKRLIRNILIIPKLIKQIKYWKTDIIYSNSSLIFIGIMLAKIMRLPHIWHLREFGKLDFGLNFDWGHSLSKYIINKSDIIIAISESIKNYYSTRKNLHKFFIVYNGIATEREFIEIRTRVQKYKKKEPHNFTFGFLGRINFSKGYQEALRALAIVVKKYPDVKLIIAGDGDIDNAKNLSKDLGIMGNVVLAGLVNDTSDIYLNVDATLMCSRYEALGRVTIESMMYMRPVIGYDQAGTSEIIKNNITGLLYNGDHHDLANKMIRLIEDRELADSFVDNAWIDAYNRFTIEESASKIFLILQNILLKKEGVIV
jgi:glycosyltransferase involved in cell wall biosynthesis